MCNMNLENQQPLIATGTRCSAKRDKLLQSVDPLNDMTLTMCGNGNGIIDRFETAKRVWHTVPNQSVQSAMPVRMWLRDS